VSQVDRRQVLRLVGAAAAAGFAGSVAGCAGTAAGRDDTSARGVRVQIGFVAPSIGPYQSVGIELTRGFGLYLDHNDSLLGRHLIDLIKVEEGGTAASTKSAVESLIQRNVLAIAGVASPEGLLAVHDDIETARIPLISAGASPTALINTLYIWRAAYLDGEAGTALGSYCAGVHPRAFLLHGDSVASRDDADAFRRAYTDGGGAIAGDRALTDGFGAALNQVRAAGVDMIFAAYGPDDGAALLAAYATAGLSQPLYAPGRLTEGTPRPRQVARDVPMPNSIYTALNYAPDLDNDSNHRFVSAYHDAYGSQPTSSAMTAYDTANLLDLALRQLGDEPAQAEVNQALSLLGQIESPRGTWTFNSNRTPQQRWYLRHLQMDGQVLANLVDADLEVLS
jgi:branched-chain amino acid transport system substrate-binding protein